MLKILCQVVMVVALTTSMTWIACTEIERTTALREVTAARSQLQRELTMVQSLERCQAYAQPAIEMARELSVQNQMFMKSVEHAKSIVKAQSIELDQTREALATSTEILQDQIEENNRCVHHIQKLEEFIAELLTKFPENDRPMPPRMPEEEELL